MLASKLLGFAVVMLLFYFGVAVTYVLSDCDGVQCGALQNGRVGAYGFGCLDDAGKKETGTKSLKGVRGGLNRGS